MRIIVTCEHASWHVPRRYRALFRGREKILKTHRGYDRGAKAIALGLSRKLRAPFFQGGATRLLVDLNRSPRHRDLFSPWTKHLSAGEKNEILKHHYLPYRKGIESRIAGWIREKRPVLHLSVHTFTPVLRGVKRNADLGILYDPKRKKERAIAHFWKKSLLSASPRLKVRFNYPYRGTQDGFVPYLRGRFPPNLYLSLELEFNCNCKSARHFWGHPS